MYNVTDNYKALIAAPVRYTGIRGTIRLKTGEIVRITDSNVVSNSLSIIKKMNGRGDLRPGGVYSSELSIGLKGFSAKTSDLDGAIIGLNFLLYNDSTMQNSETVPLGRFYADGSTIKRKNDTVTLKANDSLMQFDIPATARSGTLFELVSTACSAANVPLGMTQEEFEALPNGTMSAQVNTARIQTERDLLMYIGMATASFARAKREGGQLEFVPLTCEVNESNSIVSARQIKGNVRYTTNFSDDEVRIMKLFFMRNGEKICSTKKYTDSNTSHKITQLELLENPLLESTGDEDAQTVLNNMLVAMVKCLNRALDTDFNGDPALDIGDYVRCTGGAIDTERSYAKAMITSMVWRYHGKHTIKCVLPSSLSSIEKASAVAAMSADNAAEQADEQSMQAQPKSQTEKRIDELKGMVRPKYVSLPVTNPAAVNYDAIERGLLSVDFTVSGTDSAVVFAGAQQCSAAAAGTVDIAYKVDGATQDHKPSQALTAGKHILPHYLAMALSKGKHNFAVYITSADGRGSTPINGLAAALSGQISGIKISTVPNDNLLLYFGGVPAGTTITLPQLYSGSGADKTVDWGDGSAAETSACNVTVEHTYADGGDFVVTIKSTETMFMGSSAVAWKEYLTAVYFPDNATYISWSFLGNCPNLGTVYLGKSATNISLTLTNCAKLTSLIFPDTAVSIGVTLTGTSVTDITIPAVATTARAFNNLTSLQSIAFEGALLCSCQSDTSLKTVRMTDKINAIPDTCFSNCTSLADIDLPKTITKIGANAFSRCAKLPSLPLLPELTSVGVRAFEGCSGLSDAAFGDKLASMGIYAFHNCVSLSSVDIPSSLVTLPEGAFQACTGLTSVSHGGLMTIGAKAFEGCTQLAGFEFPSGLIVGSQAFAKTGFENVDVLSFMPLLTSGTTAYGGKYNIGAQAFANCTKLSEVSGYKYKFSVGLRVTENTKEDGVWTTTETDMGEMADALGIYNAMGATSDSVFSGTALKTAADYLGLHPEYSNESTSDYKRTYTAYDIKSTV